ncbi:MFS transporter [Bifidobacterium dentium]|uniref:MFS transporter n=1 Tax=Bifidobacterium dentium TaxID=1689 RepID=A0A7J5TK62_9BIFI|nr:MFS transporter [Bifidobacterium dentium]KAB7459071.1 MFS transporter [Bifidobacterium dentium]KAB7462426.1 MFS transporter [Bifidobacterium dentium]KAB7464587.1 MFS transporter [Bifidobacterium dentium]RYT63783.1 MFS transporter [Bifidobacterium dentium]
MSEAIASKEERLSAYYANIAAAEKDPSLSPATGKPLDKVTIARFGAGFIIFGVLWMSGLGIVSAVLLPMHYKTIEGVNPDALIGIVNAFTAVASLIANLMFGNFSDRSRSRFGRRTPWILFGAVLGGVTLFLTGTTHNAVLLTIFYCACMFGLNCMIAPMVAILSDRVPSGIHGTMSAFYGAGATIGSPIGTMLGALFIKNLIPGFAVAGVLMFLGGVVSMLIMPKEESADFLPKDEGSLKDVLVSFRPPAFHGAHDFYKAFVGRFCMLVSYQMIAVYQLYIIQNYIGQSVDESAVTVSVVSMIMMVMSLVGSFISGPVSDIIGRRKVPVVVASVLFAIGIAMPWVFPSSMGMYLFAGIAGLGYAVYSAVDQALLVDVLPNKEEAGKDLGILNMATTLGQMCGPIVMSALVVNLGYNFAFPTSIALAIIGCFFIMAIKKVK